MTPPFYRQFIERLDALRHGDAGAAPTPRWRVYANTAVLACQAALAANYPSLRHLMGGRRFEQLAGAYVRAVPADDARLFLYGASLPAVLGERDGRDSITALAATLDRCWSEAHAEADAQPLGLDWVAQQDPAAFSTLRLRPAPATRWVAHASVPAMQWWSALRQPLASGGQPRGGAQAVLLTRPGDAVIVQELPLAGAAFLHACEDGLTLPMALQAAASAAPDSNLQQMLAVLMGAGALQHPDQYIERALTCTTSWPAAGA